MIRQVVDRPDSGLHRDKIEARSLRC